MKHTIVIATALLVLAGAGGCGAQSAPASSGSGAAQTLAPQALALQIGEAQQALGTLAPEQAIRAAAAQPEDGVDGVFAFTVASVGDGRGRVFLNSESDYRDPRNLSVMLPSAAAKEMERALGGPLTERLVAKQVSVTGTAKQVKINVYESDRKKTGETRTQTRITVARVENIVVR